MQKPFVGIRLYWRQTFTEMQVFNTIQILQEYEIKASGTELVIGIETVHWICLLLLQSGLAERNCLFLQLSVLCVYQLDLSEHEGGEGFKFQTVSNSAPILLIEAAQAGEDRNINVVVGRN